MVSMLGEEYLGEPTETDLQQILTINAARGFLECIDSIDCQHCKWKNCAMDCAGQLKGKQKKPTMVLEAICEGEPWIWHKCFGSPGSRNDIIDMDHSPTLRD